MAGTYAVIGDPIEHSMSPLIHNAAFKELGMDSSYIAYRIERGDLEDGIESLKSARISGFNVTIPHKVDVLKYLDSYDDDCKQVGAANTVEISNGKLAGYNTDVKESVSSVYNIEYLTQLVRTIGKSCNNIGIEYGSQTPIKLLFEMPSMIQVSYYLAPRIEN